MGIAFATLVKTLWSDYILWGLKSGRCGSR